MTAGIIEEYRGRGLSRFLISYITEMGHREGADVWIDVWKDNLALIGDIRVGYEVQKENLIDGRVLLIMKHNRNRLHRLKEQALFEELGKTPHPGREFVQDLAEAVKEATYDPTKEMIEVNQIAIESYD
jgi:GNAT superfamily N-acetyltransferase